MPFPSKTNPEAILAAALELLERGGDTLTMRSLATRLGVRASSLYRHFPDREALEAALAEEAARRLHGALLEAAGDLGPRQALEGIARAYVSFAHTQHDLYDLLVRPRATPPFPSPSGHGKRLWNFLLERVASVTGDPDDTAATVALWSLLHGFVDLERSGAFGPSGPRGALERGVGALLDGLAARS